MQSKSAWQLLVRIGGLQRNFRCHLFLSAIYLCIQESSGDGTPIVAAGGLMMKSRLQMPSDVAQGFFLGCRNLIAACAESTGTTPTKIVLLVAAILACLVVFAPLIFVVAVELSASAIPLHPPPHPPSGPPLRGNFRRKVNFSAPGRVRYSPTTLHSTRFVPSLLRPQRPFPEKLRASQGPLISFLLLGSRELSASCMERTAYANDKASSIGL